MIGAIEQVVFVPGHFGKLPGEGWVDKDMACRAAAAAAAQREQFIEAIITNGFHYADATVNINRAFFAFTIDDNQFCHGILFLSTRTVYAHLGHGGAATDNDTILQAGRGMGLDRDTLKAGLDSAARTEPAFGRALSLVGYPEPRINERGYRTLLRTIVGQQVSTASARSVWSKLEALLGADIPPDALLASSFDDLRGCGLSRQKQGYVRSLCELVAKGALNLDNLSQDDETAISALTQVKGIGRWSAEIYLLFAEGRADIWPAGDLGVQAGLQRILGLAERPDEKAARAMAEAWRPDRGAIAIFTWHCYDNPTL